MNMKYVLALVFLSATQASAHGVADNHLQIMVVDNRIKMNIVVDMRVLAIADADTDGYASLDELAARSHEIKEWVSQSFKVSDSSGEPGSIVFADVTSDLNIASAKDGKVDHARILQTLAFPGPVTDLKVDLEQVARLVPELRVTIIDAATGLRYKLRDPRTAQTITLPT